MFTQISNPMNYRVGEYLRLSKEDFNEKESESIANQRSLIGNFARDNKLDICKTYIDDGYSGTNFDRPGFQQMVKDIESGQINMVITKDLSRLGRDYIQTGHYLERYFPEHQVRYISLLDGIDTGIDSTVNDITPFKAIMNDMYAKDISRKITSVKRDKQKKGLFIGGKAPYGYQLSKTQKNTIVVDNKAAPVVRRIFELASTGISCRQIAVILNEDGIPTPSAYAGIKTSKKGAYSGLWSSERISFMLKNEVYIGNMVQGRVKKINYKLKKSQKLPPEEWTVVENTHEPIVSKDLFQKVGQLIESRNHTRTRKHDYLLKGIIFCHECGYPLGVVMRTLAGNRPTLYFLCRTYQRFTSYHKCTCHCVRVDTVTEAVITKIKELCNQYLNHNKCNAIIKQAVQDAEAENRVQEEITAITGQVQNLTAQLDKMYTDKLSGVLDKDDFERIYIRIKNERNQLQKELKKRTAEKKEAMSPNKEAGPLLQKFLDATEYNRELLVSLVERIELTENKEVIIHFRFRQLDALSHLQ